MKEAKPDLTTEADIKQMVDSFYDKVNKDTKLSPVFNDFAGVNWQEHLPKMYRFWNTLILGQQSYKGKPFDAHVPLPVDAQHFDRWVALFIQNMDEQFEGPVAEDTKLRARSIAHVFQTKLEYIHSQNQ